MISTWRSRVRAGDCALNRTFQEEEVFIHYNKWIDKIDMLVWLSQPCFPAVYDNFVYDNFGWIGTVLFDTKLQLKSLSDYVNIAPLRDIEDWSTDATGNETLFPK